MDYPELVALQKHPAWGLLRSPHAPLMVHFFQTTFTEPNVRSLNESQLTSRLDDLLYALAQTDATEYPRDATHYLSRWADDSNGWLRKYYVTGEDEARFELTPATEKAIEWLESLGKRQFIGTESRLLSIFELLRQVVEGSQSDPQLRLAELERRRAELDEEIARVRAGDIELMDETRVRERFLDVTQTARSLLADFREVEQNFRDLDREVRERITTWTGSKAELLERFFNEREAIGESDQGRSFRAFWEFLMSPARQRELSELLNQTFKLPAVQQLEPDRRLLRMHYDWLEAGDSAQRTLARLSEQLRRYVDDQAWLEDRRIMQLLQGIEGRALALRDTEPEIDCMTLDSAIPDIRLPLDRPLYTPPLKPQISQQILLEGDAEGDTAALFTQEIIDKAELKANIREALRGNAQISLAQVLERHPLHQGLAELVTYLDLAAHDDRTLFDEEHPQLIVWQDRLGRERRASIPLIIFSA